MNILIIGSGGREHALACECAKSPHATTVYVAPGNAGTAMEPKCENVDIDVNDTATLLAFAIAHFIDLTIVGPEMPLAFGIVDKFQKYGLKILGPSQEAAQLEVSKLFAKASMNRHRISTADWRGFQSYDRLRDEVRNAAFPIVLKADTLCAGKGVLVAHNEDEALEFLDQLENGAQCGHSVEVVIIEKCQMGTEMSFITVVDKNGFNLPLPSSQDHKARFDGGEGPNTGGMGAYSPSSIMTDELHDRIMREVMIPTVKGMAKDGHPYMAFLYAGLMIGKDGSITVLEYNVRLGDPETQPILMRLKSDFVELCMAAVDGTLDTYKAKWDPNPTVGVVLVSEGYPGDYEKGFALVLPDKLPDGVKIFHAGTKLDTDSNIISTGGRVLCVCASGDNFTEAQEKAYKVAVQIRANNPNLDLRSDIADSAINS